MKRTKLLLNQVRNKFLAFFLRERNVFLFIVILYVVTHGYVFITDRKDQQDNVEIEQLYTEIDLLKKQKSTDTLNHRLLTLMDKKINFLESSLLSKLKSRQEYLSGQLKLLGILVNLPYILAILLFPVRWILMFLFNRKIEL